MGLMRGNRAHAPLQDKQESHHLTVSEHASAVVPAALTNNSTGSTSLSSRQEWARATAPSGPVSPRIPHGGSMGLMNGAREEDGAISGSFLPSGAMPASPSSIQFEHHHHPQQQPQHRSHQQCVIINPPGLHRQMSGEALSPLAPGGGRRTGDRISTNTSSSPREAVVASLSDILKVVQSTLPRAVDGAISLSTGCNAVAKLDEFFRFHDDDDENSVDEEEEERQQMRRLGSWNTLETMATSASDVGSSALSYYSHPSHHHHHHHQPPTTVSTKAALRSLPLRDDDGNVIDPALLESRSRHHRKAKAGTSRRKTRIVQFEYPPVSSLRQCPRADPNDLPSLFFTEAELEVFERDRESTYTADDIEIVAISSPASTKDRAGGGGGVDGFDDHDEEHFDFTRDVRQGPCSSRERPPTTQGSHSEAGSSALHPQQPSSPSLMHRSSSGGGGFGGFGNYISTPRVIWNKKRQQQLLQQSQQQILRKDDPTSSFHTGGHPGPKGGTNGLPPPSPSAASAPGSRQHSRGPRQEQQRLIKSVQIFLRERSAG